jgi:hypothetical protein
MKKHGQGFEAWPRALRLGAAALILAAAAAGLPARAAAKKDDAKKPAAAAKKPAAAAKKPDPKKADPKKNANKPAAKKSSSGSARSSTKAADKTPAAPVWIPPGFDEAEAAAWKSGTVPGWGFGDGDAWSGEIPATLADRKPPDWDTWTDEQKESWQKALAESRQAVLGARGSYSDKDIKRIACSLEMAARQGAPISTVAQCVKKGMERGLTAFEMERLTRAFASANRANVDIYLVSQHVESLVQGGTRGAALARGAYARIKSLGV